MSLAPTISSVLFIGFPRVSGDEPYLDDTDGRGAQFSPCERG